MSNKFVLLGIVIVAVFISGYILGKDDSNGANPTVKPEFIPTSNLPAGLTYMGTHETAVNIGGSSMNATEGIYRDNKDENEIYIQVIKDDNPVALIAKYRSRYKDANYNPFQDIYFNGHKATQITDYRTIVGKQEPYYTVIWANGNYMILVGSSADTQTVTALAAATGY